MSKYTRWLALAALASLLASVAPSSDASEYRRCRGRNVTWGSDAQTLQANQNDFPAGSAWRASLQSSVNAWNASSPATRFRFGLIFNTAADNDLGDGRNSVVRVADIAGNAVMVARSRLSACLWPFWRREIREVDIVAEDSFNGIAAGWDFATNPHPSNAWRNTTIVFVHELGHAFGLLHENDVLATMNDTTPNGGSIGNDDDAHPHADDVLGNRIGYGTNAVASDLIASTFRRTTPGDSEPINTPGIVSRGNPTIFQFTVGNRGTTSRTAQVRFYLSTDRRITTADTQVGSTTLAIDAGVNRTLNASVTVPFTVAPGFYHFGYIIDPTNTVGEVDEGNNAAGHVGRTRVSALSPPNACFTVTPTFGEAPLVVNLDASCSSDADGSITDYSWDMGDGGLAFGETPSYLYFGDGDFTVTLTVTDNDGQTDTAVRSVFVTCPGQFFCEL